MTSRSTFRRATSIRARMTAAFACFISLLMLLVCSTFFVYTKLADRRAADALLTQAQNEITLELQHGKHTLSRPAELLDEEGDEMSGAGIAILIADSTGHVVARSKNNGPSWPPQGDRWRIKSFLLQGYTIVVGVPWHKAERELRERTLFLLGLSVLVVALSSLGAWSLVGRTLSPIDALARQASAASAESLRLQLQAPSGDAEIIRLVATLNDLLERVAQTVAARGRFYAAASHELRTPLQGLSGVLEVALSRPRDPEEYKRVLAESHAQAERLTALVQDLLFLNQLDQETARPPAMLLDIADICESEFGHLRPLARDKALKIELDLPPSCEMNAPWTHATMLIRNLLENAVKYAVPGGGVRIQVRGGTFQVWNECEPVGFEVERYFEPFYRPDAARHSATGGNGLGLAICKAICEVNGWWLELRPEQRGMSARVKLFLEK